MSQLTPAREVSFSVIMIKDAADNPDVRKVVLMGSPISDNLSMYVEFAISGDIKYKC